MERGADYVVMLHPDYQYDSRVVEPAVQFLKLGICDVVLGSRIRTRKETLAGGMPRYKYVANRALTTIENIALGQNVGDFHSGFRAYRRGVLDTIPFEKNSDDFVFDSQFLAQAVHFGFRLGDVANASRPATNACLTRHAARRNNAPSAARRPLRLVAQDPGFSVP
jgi:hypothetical protein